MKKLPQSHQPSPSLLAKASKNPIIITLAVLVTGFGLFIAAVLVAVIATALTIWAVAKAVQWIREQDKLDVQRSREEGF